MLGWHARVLHRAHGKGRDERAALRLPRKDPPPTVYPRLLSRRLCLSSPYDLRPQSQNRRFRLGGAATVPAHVENRRASRPVFC